jgi:hypothetical protein
MNETETDPLAEVRRLWGEGANPQVAMWIRCALLEGNASSGETALVNALLNAAPHLLARDARCTELERELAAPSEEVEPSKFARRAAMCAKYLPPARKPEPRRTYPDSDADLPPARPEWLG